MTTCSLFAKSVDSSTMMVTKEVCFRTDAISRDMRKAMTFNSSFCMSAENYLSDFPPVIHFKVWDCPVLVAEVVA